ncbi:Osmotically-inducible protein Y [Sodalis praecaptivus]|uniref:molecular chaperone OsmY n=1 Tax=Sodalis praecaptivus TaxID=1239307 RepID=UPI0027FBF9C3|nr:molecular chaperone OsmY [Sodalis praecaptivus]CAJ0994775.1 Osmotically-inducible protein Y [Sodalis praecaptivus]
MNKTKIAQSLTAIVLGSVLAGASAMADTSVTQDAKSAANTTGQKIDSSMKSASGYMGDSAITAKVKSALVGNEAVNSNDISVETNEGVVTLSGFVANQSQAEKAISSARTVKGVKSVSDKLHVKETNKTSVKTYASDAAITSEVKAKFLADKSVLSRMIKVETTDGIVQLSGKVENATQITRAESVAKAVDGVKSVKNDLTSGQ